MQMSCFLHKEKEGSFGELQDSQPYLDTQEGDRASKSGDCFQMHIKDTKIIWSHWYGFSKGKSCLTNLLALYDEITSLVDKERAEDVNHLNFS